jgi:hypothetical protein
VDFSVETGVFVTIRGDGSREKDKEERYQKILESGGLAGRVPQQVALTIPPKAGLVRVQPEAQKLLYKSRHIHYEKTRTQKTIDIRQTPS